MLADGWVWCEAKGGFFTYSWAVLFYRRWNPLWSSPICQEDLLFFSSCTHFDVFVRNPLQKVSVFWDIENCRPKPGKFTENSGWLTYNFLQIFNAYCMLKKSVHFQTFCKAWNVIFLPIAANLRLNPTEIPKVVYNLSSLLYQVSVYSTYIKTPFSCNLLWFIK